VIPRGDVKWIGK